MSHFPLPVVSTTITNNQARVEFHSSTTLLFILTELFILCSLQLILFSGLLTVPSHVAFLFCSFIFFIPTLGSSSSANQSGLRKFQLKVGHEQPREFQEIPDVRKLAESNKVEEAREKKPSIMKRPESACSGEHEASKENDPCRDQKGSLGSSDTVAKEYEKTLAWRLLAVRHGASGGECVMDLMWEACDTVEKVKEKREGKMVFCDDGGGGGDDDAVQGCLGRALSCSSWKLNLRRKRESGIAKITKALTKRAGWFGH